MARRELFLSALVGLLVLAVAGLAVALYSVTDRLQAVERTAAVPGPSGPTGPAGARGEQGRPGEAGADGEDAAQPAPVFNRCPVYLVVTDVTVAGEYSYRPGTLDVRKQALTVCDR